VNNVNTDLFLDYLNTSVTKLVMNGKNIEKINWNGLFINLPKGELKAPGNDNVIYLEFSCKYVNDGSGLHSFVDTDGK
jgi:aminopeptidase N